MQAGLKEQFIQNWEKYFMDAALSISFYYTDQEPQANKVRSRLIRNSQYL